MVGLKTGTLKTFVRNDPEFQLDDIVFNSIAILLYFIDIILHVLSLRFEKIDFSVRPVSSQ